MKKNVVNISESQLRSIIAESVKKALSEKTATMPEIDLDDINKLQDITYNLNDYPRPKDYSSYAEVLDDIDSHFRAIVTIFNALEAPSDYLWNITDNAIFEKYVNYLDTNVERLRRVVARMRDLAIMKTGGTPDKGLKKGIYRDSSF